MGGPTHERPGKGGAGGRWAKTCALSPRGVDQDLVSLILMHGRPGARTTHLYDRSERLEERRRALRRRADLIDGLRR